MSDGGKGPIGGTFEDIDETVNEAVVEPVKDAIGEMVEQGIQSVVGTNLTPQQVQQKQIDDQEELVKTRKKIKWIQDLAAAQRRVRDQEKQKQMQKQQEEQEQQDKKIPNKQVVMPASKGKPAVQPSEEIARSRQEIGKGHGVGG